MRTIEQIRQRLIEHLGYACRRPGMWVYPPRGVDGYFLDILANICFIDEREDEFNAALDAMKQKELSTNAGVFGAFYAGFNSNKIEIDHLYREVTSIYAQLAWNLGYLTIDRVLSKAEWTKLRKGLRQKSRNKDWFQSDIREQYGEPSLNIGTVYCYATDQLSEGWVFFDFWTEYMRDGANVSHKYRENPILRNVRLPARTLRRGLSFTPYGRQYAHK